MKTSMKIATLLAAVCITTSVGILVHFEPPSVEEPRPVPRGYSSGLACYQANGCEFRATFTQCLKCCNQHCPIPWYDGCVDACIAQYDPKKVHAALIDASEVITNELPGEIQGEARALLVAVQYARDERTRHIASLVARDAEDAIGTTGIYVERAHQ